MRNCYVKANLVTNPGGSGTFFDLAAVLNRDGNPKHVATAFLGERADIQTFYVEEDTIVIEMITHGPDDPMCCPTQAITIKYRLEGEQLVKVAEEIAASEESEEPAVGGDSITTGTWQWASLVETAPAAQSVVPNPDNYTLIFQPDSTLNIKADCNMVGGSYTLEGNALTIALGPSTMAFCGEQSLDQQYLALLRSVNSYVVENGQLMLNLGADAGRMTLTN